MDQEQGIENDQEEDKQMEIDEGNGKNVDKKKKRANTNNKRKKKPAAKSRKRKVQLKEEVEERIIPRRDESITPRSSPSKTLYDPEHVMTRDQLKKSMTPQS